MGALGVKSLAEYLDLVKANTTERGHLISALTIHTTSWFREYPHFVAFQEMLLDALEKNEIFKVWCAACSTGEEVYSFALVLEEFRRVHPQFDYQLLGTDIDPISVAVAERAIYNKRGMSFHVLRYKAHVLEGSGKTAEFFTLSKSIRDRCKFLVHDLRQETLHPGGLFHVVICRNVLIYFSPQTVARAIPNLMKNMRSDGHLMLGHSESIHGPDFSLAHLGNSVYSKCRIDESRRTSDKGRVLCIDDSATTRKFLSKLLLEMGFDAVTVGSGSEAANFLNFNEVDLITLDLKMPHMSGDKWLRVERAKGLKVPVVVISDAHPSEAKEVVDILAVGAQDYFEKDTLTRDSQRLKDVIVELTRAHEQDEAPVAHIGRTLPNCRPQVILIGASTGGPQALVRLLADLPSDCPPILVTQHMSPMFMRSMGERIAAASGLKLGSGEDMTPMEPGHVYMSFGDYHAGVGVEKNRLMFRTSAEQPYNGHRPSVDYMFNSALGAQLEVMGILLTGMGRDGALGLRFLRKEGAFCIAQSEEDCIVYGMPRVAIEREAACFVGTIPEIRKVLLDSLRLPKKSLSAA
jgi:two-component system chemotaxis response regulator CheB